LVVKINDRRSDIGFDWMFGSKSALVVM